MNGCPSTRHSPPEGIEALTSTLAPCSERTVLQRAIRSARSVLGSFCAEVPIAKMTLSNNLRARSTRSVCPLVIGLNDPGYTTVLKVIMVRLKFFGSYISIHSTASSQLRFTARAFAFQQVGQPFGHRYFPYRYLMSAFGTTLSGISCCSLRDK